LKGEYRHHEEEEEEQEDQEDQDDEQEDQDNEDEEEDESARGDKEVEEEDEQEEGGEEEEEGKQVAVMDVATLNSYTEAIRKRAMDKKKNRQLESAEKEMKRCGDAAVQSGVSPGAMVSLKVDYRTFFNPQGILAIVYEMNPLTGSVKVCGEHGVITHDGDKGDYWVPADGYLMKAAAGTFFPLSNELEAVRKLVQDGKFDGGAGCPRISYSKMHQQQMGAPSPLKKAAKGCGCKNGMCGPTCGCRRKKQSCHSGCSCNGNCGGPVKSEEEKGGKGKGKGKGKQGV
jgi:hypothetical protein